MGFWQNVNHLPLKDFRPGISSLAQAGERLLMATMEIGPGQRDQGHEHPFDQCGLVVQGKIEMFIGQESRVLSPLAAYFIPAGVHHGWRTFDSAARIVDISPKRG